MPREMPTDRKGEGFYDRERFIPYTSVKGEYELELHDKQALNDIRKRLKAGKFTSRDECLDSIQYLEDLNAKLSNAIRNEESAGKDNWTLKMARDDVLKLFTQLRQKASEMEEQ